MSVKHDEITILLEKIGIGDGAARSELAEIVYEELRRIACRAFEGMQQEGLQPTALVHEAFMKLVSLDVGWDGRQHFFALAARVMRQLLAGEARRERALKRGGNKGPKTLVSGAAIDPGLNLDILDLEEAMVSFSEKYPREARVVELRFYAGLSIEETAELLELSGRTVKRDWHFARAWLRQRLLEGEA